MHLTIATAGHVDHGKSALVQALTGTNPDRLAEEQARGISIELGFAHAQVRDVTLSFIDVPGHERFVRTMLAGVGGIDAVLLVVAADASVMPQTREHFDICRLLDVRTGVVALTRSDLADETMQAVSESDVQALLAGTALAAAPIIRVSALTGEGLTQLQDALVRCATGRRAREADAPVRLPVDRAFTVRGFGTVVTGTLWSGSVVTEQELHLWPGGARVRVRGLQVHGAAAVRAEAGQRVAVNLAGVTLDDVTRGHVLLGAGAATSSRRLAVEVDVLPDAPPQRHGTRLHVHLGTSVVLGRLLLPAGDATSTGRVADAGARVKGVLRLESPLPARRGDRLVLRSYSPLSTVAGARVLDPAPMIRQWSGTSAFADVVEIDALALARVREAGAWGCPAADLPPRLGVGPSGAEAVTRSLAATGAIVAVGTSWVSAQVLRDLRTPLLDAIDEGHRADPLAGGVPRASLRALCGRRWRAEVVDLVLATLAAEGAVTGDERVARVSAVSRDPVEDTVLAAIAASELQGVTRQALESAGAAPDRKGLAAVLARLSKDRHVELVGDLYVGSAHLRGLVDELRRLAVAGEVPARIEVGWFKQRYGLTRRSAIPLLEWLDRTRVTRREGEARVLIGS